MRRISLLLCALLLLSVAGLWTAAAQFPRLPKIPKPKPTPNSTPQPTTNNGAPPADNGAPPAQPAAPPTNSAADDGQPFVYKDSVQPNAYKVGSYHGSFDVWAWKPAIAFRINGPIPSGAQLYTEFSVPGSPVVKSDCPTQAIDKTRTWMTECGGTDIPDDKGTTYTGPVKFAIKMRNELAGTDTTIFNGTMKVGKVHSNEVGPKAAQKFVYYVDRDWNLPIGYVYLTPDQVYGWEDPEFHAVFWVRGRDVKIEPHLFYQGKEVGTTTFEGETKGGSCGRDTDIKNSTELTDVDEAVQYRYNWSRIRCDFPYVKGWDRTGQKYGLFGPPHTLAKNPGDYELKVLWNSHLARSLKFTVGPDGKFDNGIASANKLGSGRVIVPVQIIGDQDGQWDRNAWKTEAFYGNPLTGFTPAP